MTNKMLIAGLILMGAQSFAATSSTSIQAAPPGSKVPFVGVSVFKFESQKPTSQNIDKNQIAMDGHQPLAGACPAKSELVKADCEASAHLASGRPMIDELQNRGFASTHEVPSLQDGLTPGIHEDVAWVHTIVTKTEIDQKTQSATCKALNPRPDEVVKLSMSLKCMGAVALQDAPATSQKDQNVPIEK